MKNKTITLSPHDVINEVLDKLVHITSAEKEIGSYFRILETNKKEMIAPSCGVSQLHDKIFTSYRSYSGNKLPSLCQMMLNFLE